MGISLGFATVADSEVSEVQLCGHADGRTSAQLCIVLYCQALRMKTEFLFSVPVRVVGARQRATLPRRGTADRRAGQVAPAHTRRAVPQRSCRHCRRHRHGKRNELR